MAHTSDRERPPSPIMQPAFHPLSSASAEITLRSKDELFYSVSAETLSRTSAWFRTMLSLPQTSAESTKEATPMDENGDLIASLLSIVSGTDLPDLGNIDKLEAILQAADKYEMPLAIATLRMALFSPFLHASPIRLYEIACRMSWEREAKLASSRTLTLDLFAPEVMSELVALEPAHRDKLLALHRRRRDALAESLDNTTIFYANLRGTPCNRNDGVNRCTAPLDHGAWSAFKYAFIRRVERGLVGEELDGDFYRMRELWDLRMAHCHVCKRIVYNMPNTLENLQKIVKELPKSIEWSRS
ncbi:hypothetical protein BD310DRAFT_913823 [Dichomitus squalens]|uniref:BTB domain-containing protein n=1 Tax=Dichomitus squalens TaxID=114155 RepID=A0A4Q9QE05_9APHY|nr:hypothetical protein BD310DRAFT_913823 [Dichomitus squalens]